MIEVALDNEGTVFNPSLTLVNAVISTSIGVRVKIRVGVRVSGLGLTLVRLNNKYINTLVNMNTNSK